MFIALGSTMFAPAAHMWRIQGMKEGLQGYALMNIAVMILLDLLALFFYLAHIPEKWSPHTFDIWVSGPSYFPNVYRETNAS